MRARVSQKVSPALEAEIERRGDNRLTRDGNVVQRIVEPERKTQNEQGRPDLDRMPAAARMADMLRRECAVDRARRKRVPVDLDDGDIDRPGTVLALAPRAPAISIQRYREVDARRQIVGVDMQLDLDPVRHVLARFVDEHMTARHQDGARRARRRSRCPSLEVDHRQTFPPSTLPTVLSRTSDFLPNDPGSRPSFEQSGISVA